MVHRLMELNVAHLEWWHPIDIVEKFGNKIYNNIRGQTQADEKKKSGPRLLIPVFIIEKVTLIDYEQIEVNNGRFSFTHGGSF